MKTRSGFVSNSSSSSFVVAFKKKPENSYELLDLLFRLENDNLQVGVESPYGEETVDALSAATIIWDQLKDQKPLTKKQIEEEIRSGWFDGHPEWNAFRTADVIRVEYYEKFKKNIYDENADPEWKSRHEKAQEKDWKDYEEAINQAAKDACEKTYPRFKGKKAYRFTFSDNDGSVFATLEHGDTFKALPHIKISHH